MSAFVVLGIRGLMWAAERIVASRALPKQEQPPATAVAKPERTIATARPRSEGAVGIRSVLGPLDTTRGHEAQVASGQASARDGTACAASTTATAAPRARPRRVDGAADVR